MQAYIGGFLQNQKNIWDDHNSLIIFFAGSNYSFNYNNNDFIEKKKEFFVNLELIENQIRKDSSLIDSVIIKGGEATLQKEALINLLKIAKEEHLRTCLFTNGTKPSVIKELLNLKLLDKVVLDFVSPLDNEWKNLVKYTGYFDNEEEAMNRIRKTIELIQNIEHDFYSYIVNGVVFRKEQFLEIVKEIPENSNLFLQYCKQIKSFDYLISIKKEIENYKKINVRI